MAATKYDIYIFLNGEKVKNSEEMELLIKTLDVSADGNDNGMKISEDAGKFDFNAKKIGNIGAADSSGQAVEYAQYTTALGLKLDADQAGAANGVATLGADGKIPSSQVPSVALVDVYVESSEASHLALDAQEGDVVKRTDLGTTWIHNGGSAGTMADWTTITADGAVDTVNGQTGTVVLTTSDISEGSNLYFTDARARTAVVLDTLSGSETNQAPSVNAVNNALDGKEDTITAGTTSQYYRGDKTFQTLNTTAVSEGSNLYFTDARARTAAVVNNLTGSESNQAPSSAAVNVALDAKEDLITAGTTSQYYRGDKTFQTLNTTAVSEGTNLYFTDTRAKSAVVVSTVEGSQTDQAPSVNVVRIALDGKEDTISAGTTSQYYRGDKTFQELNTTAVTEGNNLYYTDQRAKDAVGETRTLSNANVGSETIEIGNICYLSGAGEVKLAKADEANLGPDVALYVAKEQVAYGASGEFYAPNKGTYLSGLSGYSGMTPNDEFYLDKAVAGSHTNDASGFTTGDHLIRLGKKEAANAFRWDPRYLFEYA